MSIQRKNNSTMKKLLILLFSTLISFNSFAGGLDGKGLKCKNISKYATNNRPFYVWFANNESYLPVIVGETIRWWGGYRYREVGTRYVRFEDDLFNNPYRFEFPLSVLWYHKLDRSNLKLPPLIALGIDPYWICSVMYNKQRIVSELQVIINNSSSGNKI
jgi:hypothetical protein